MGGTEFWGVGVVGTAPWATGLVAYGSELLARGLVAAETVPEFSAEIPGEEAQGEEIGEEAEESGLEENGEGMQSTLRESDGL